MRRWLSHRAHRLRQRLRPQAAVLLYHRVAVPDEADVWALAVSPAHFEQHLQVLRQLGRVVPAATLTRPLPRWGAGRLRFAITFDDGYLDNYTAAAPLLTRYQLPATFFAVAAPPEAPPEFWWDELAVLVLLTEQLPGTCDLGPAAPWPPFALPAEQRLTPALRQQHQRWRAEHAPPPTRRAALYYQLWQQLKPLPASEQQHWLGRLRAWARQPPVSRPAFARMAPAQLRELAGQPLFTIGAHTLTHPALASQPRAVQAHELQASRLALETSTGCPTRLLAYPYGSYAPETAALAARLGYEGAFTTRASCLTAAADPYRLGRFQVLDWSGEQFRQQLRQWLGR